MIESMCCAHCGPGPDGHETLVKIDCDGEEIIVSLDEGWCFRFMTNGPKLRLEIYCPSCSTDTMNAPTFNTIEFKEPEPPFQETFKSQEINLKIGFCQCGHSLETHGPTGPMSKKVSVLKCFADNCMCQKYIRQ